MKFAQQLFRLFAARPAPRVRAVAPAPLMLALEPRIVYEASLGVVPVAHHVETSHHHVDHAAGAKPSMVPGEGAVPGTVAGGGTGGNRESELNHKTELAATAREGVQPEKQVVFIDPNVTDYQELIAGLTPGTRYVVLNPNTDGLEQIAQYLEQHPGIQAIHLISHGSEGEVQVGATWLNANDVSQYSAELAQIGAAMAPGGDFLIYGCDVAEGSNGQTLVQQIASATHLNVAASTDLTGATSLGGDWTLEYEVGVVKTPAIFTAQAEAQYGYVLAETIEDFTNADDAGYDSGTTSSFSLDGITYTITKTNGAGENVVTQDPNLQGLTDETASDNALLFDEADTGGTSAITITMQDGRAFNIQSLDIDVIADASVTFLANGVATGVPLVSDNGFVTQTVELSSGNSAFADVTSVTIEGGDMEVTLGHIVYSELTPPIVTTTGGATTFTSVDSSSATPVTIDPGLTVTDTEAATATSATVSITGNFHSGEDVLGFTNTSGTTFGNISEQSYNATTGVLTLTSSGSTATTAQWQAALDAVTYLDTAAHPNTAARTISFTLNDGIASSTAVIKTVDVDSPPIVTTSGGTTGYPGGTGATTVDSGVTVTDPSRTTQTSATVTIGTGFESGDTLAFSNTSATLYGNISGSYDSGTHVLTLTSASGTATDAQWTDALEAVQFTSTSASYGDRTVSFVVNDGTDNSVAATKTVDVTNPAPVLTTDSGSAAFVAGDNTTSTPVTVDSGLTLTDPGTSTLGSATAAITGNFQSGEDLLGFSNTSSTTFGNISASYDSGTGVLTLTSASASATTAQWQAALEAITYTDTAITPNNATRTIIFTTTDSRSDTSNTATRTVTVADTDQTPVVTTTGGTTSDVGGTSPVAIDGGVTVSDRDNTTQLAGTVSIGAGFASGDTLTFSNTGATLYGNITAVYNSTTGVMALSSSGATATDAQWANALEAVTFSTASTSFGNRTISFAVNDGTESSAVATKTVDVTNPAPVVTTDSGSAAFVAGDNTSSTPVTVDPGLTVTDPGTSRLASATVAITGNFHAGEDVLGFSNTNGTAFGNISASYDVSVGVLTLTSAGNTATLAQWQAALDAVAYTDTAVTPNHATRTISFSVTDADSNTSAAATRTVTVTDTDQTPIVTTTGGTTNYVGGTSAATIDGGVAVTDLDNTTQASGTVSITGGLQSGDTLTFSNTSATLYGNITASYNPATGVLTLTSAGATSTDAQWANAFDAVSFSAGSNATPGNRTVSFVVNDGTENSVAATDTVDVLGPPTVTTDSGSAAFTAGDNVSSTPVAIDSGLTVTDGGTSTLASATVAITGNLHSGEDVLAFTNNGATMGNITGSYNATTGVLTLTSAGSISTLAQWQAALDSVTYTDTAITPNTATRTVSFTVTDANSDTSNTATRTVTVADVDQTPVLTTTGGTTNYVGGTSAVAIDGGVTVTDLDNATQASGTVSITTGFHSGDTLTFTNTSSTLYGNIAASYDSTTGVLTLTSAGATSTDAQWQNAFDVVSFSSGLSATLGNRTVSFAVNDGTENSAAATRTVTVSVTDQTPLATGGGNTLTYTDAGNGGSPVLLDPGVTLSDRDDATLTTATVSISNGFDSSQDVLSFTSSAATGSITGSYNATTGVLTLSSNGIAATLAQWDAALDSVSFSESGKGSAGQRIVTFTVSDGIKTSQPIGVTVKVVTLSTSTTTTTTTSTDLPAAVSHPPGEGAWVNGPPPGEQPGDPVSNPLIVLDALDQVPAIGTTPSPLTITFTDPNAQHSHLPVDYTSVSAVSPDLVFDSSAADSSMFGPIPAVVDFNAAPNRPFSLNLSGVVPTVDGLRLNAASDVSLQLADGRPLPVWLHYDASTGTLSGVMPAATHDVRISVQQRDAAGHVTRSEIVLAPSSQHAHHAHTHPAQHAARHALTHVVERATAQAPLPAGKPSLAQQFAQARAALHVVRPAANATTTAAVPEHRA